MVQFSRGAVPENVKFAVYIDRNKNIWGADEVLATEILASYGKNSKSEMTGNSDRRAHEKGKPVVWMKI